MNKLSILIAASFFTGCLNAASVPLIGLDSKGNEIERSVSEMEFNGWMKKAASSSSEIMKEGLLLKSETQAGLKLKQVDLGLGIKAELGLGDVVKVSAEPSITFKFKRSN